ncbi:MAG: gamma carbonic anhydrase family protein [Methanobacteriota archaeon]|nr:MAG: gamma carbonic anhydrase family protein [Euryarchaeota archaeon]
MTLRGFGSSKPTVDTTAYVDDDALLIGDVVLKAGASVWPGAILRGDDGRVEIGDGSAVMDVAFAEAPRGRDVVVDRGCIISHGARLHGCRVERGALVGIGAVVLDRATVGEGAIVAAGAVVPPGATIEKGTLAAGVPASVRRKVTEAEGISIADDLAAVRAKAEEYGQSRV